MTRILVISDKHCGHFTGLCPPDYWLPEKKKPRTPKAKRDNKFAKFQRESWKWYTDKIDSLKPIDIIFDLGDNIEGEGKKTCGERVADDLAEQCEMACQCIEYAKGKKTKLIMVYGTPYHVGGQQTDWEDDIAHHLNAEKIGSRELIGVNGLTFDLRHKTGRSTVPYGRGTAIAKQWLWDELYASRGLLEKTPDVILRGHVHYHVFVGDPYFLGMTCPALQWHTKYGARECDGAIDYGMIHFDVDKKGGYTWQSHIAKLEHQKRLTLKL